MRLRSAVTCLLLIAGMSWITSTPAQQVSSSAAQAVQEQGHARVLVTLRSRTSAVDPRRAEQRRMESSRTIERMVARLPRDGARVVRRLERQHAVALDVDARALRTLRANPDVLRIDLDVGGGGHAVAVDEASTLNGVAQLAGHELDGAGMKVAVIDTGVDTDHADLAARLVGEQCFCSMDNGCCPNGQTTQAGAGSAEDDHGHGTHVAGIMVGEGHVAPRGALPRSSLVAVKVMDSNNRFCCISDIVAALDWVAVHHPDVDAVNLSLGTTTLFDGHCDAAAGYTQALSTAVDALVKLGAVVTVSTGNQGSTSRMAAPACLRDVTSVAATWDYTGSQVSYLGCTDATTAPRKPTCFSNRSSTTDLFAAGAFVSAPGRNGGMATYGGTSMAAPMTGACSVALKQAAPASTVAQRVDAMSLSTTRIFDPASGRSYPHLDCIDAVRLLNPTTFDPIARNGAAPLVPPADGPVEATAFAPVQAAMRATRATPQRQAPRKPSLRSRYVLPP